MDPLNTELKRAREAKRMSLSDVADATLISLGFLEQVERGNYSFLPQTYVRAFVRDYAKAVDLNPDEMIRRFEEVTGTAPPKVHAKKEITPPLVPEAGVLLEPPSESRSIQPRTARIATVVVLVLAAAVAIWNLVPRAVDTPVQETPFDKVIKEHEQRAVPSDSSENRQTTPAAPSTPDSLVLIATARDSAWMQLRIDNTLTRKYILRPGQNRSWKAAERFSVTLGNAGAVDFMLNKKNIGRLGKPGAVVRNVELTRSNIEHE